MSIPNLEDGRLLTVIVSSMRSRDRERFSDLKMPDASILVFITDPMHAAAVPLTWLQDAYELTAAEAKVALAASSGAAIPHIAELLNVSENTIKTHLRRIYMKTGTNRQAELGRLVLSFSSLMPDISQS